MHKSGRVYYDGKEVQGCRIHRGLFTTNVEITAEQYARVGIINGIYTNREIICSQNRLINIGIDAYCYLAEPGKLNSRSINEIKKILGSKRAEGCITIKIVININRVWIGLKRGYPIKYAIEAKTLPINAPKKNKGYRIRIGNKIEFRAA